MPGTITDQSETMPAEKDRKVLRQWYQGKLAERMIQAASMAQDHSLLRRGARKMQDGTLGTTASDPEEEPVNITIGDQIFNQAAPATQVTPAVSPAQTVAETAVSAAKATASFWQQALLSAAMVAGGAGVGAGIPWLFGAFDKPAAVQAASDTDTQYILSIKPK